MSSSKERIIECAQALFHLRGYKSTSIDDILRSSNVTKSNLYYHFSSKEALGLLILERRIKEYEDTLFTKTLNSKTLTPYNKLNNYYKNLITYHKKLDCKLGCPFGNLALELSSTNEKFRTRISTFFDHWQKQIELCIREGIKQKEFRDDISPKAISQLILSHTEGAIMMTKVHRSIGALSTGSKSALKLIKL